MFFHGNQIKMKSQVFSLALAAITSCGSFVFAADKDIVDTAVAAGSFKTLAAALGAGDLPVFSRALVRSLFSLQPTLRSRNCQLVL